MEEAFQVPLPIEAYVHLHPSHAGKGLARSASNHSEGSGALSMSTASRARKAGNQTPTPRSRSTLQVPTPRSRVQTPSGALGARPRASVVQGSGARRAGGGGGLPPRHASRVGGTLLTSATGTPVAAQLALSMGIPTRRNSLVNAASPLVPQMSMTLPVRRSASMSPPRGEAGDEAESAPPPAPPSAAPAPARRPIALLPLSRVPARREQDEAHGARSHTRTRRPPLRAARRARPAVRRARSPSRAARPRPPLSAGALTLLLAAPRRAARARRCGGAVAVWRSGGVVLQR